jgi:hypothetical protein
MEKQSSQEHQTPSTESSLDALSRKLGFVENDDLTTIRDLLTRAAAMDDMETVNNLLYMYQLSGEKAVNRLQGSDYMQGQIGLIVAKATLHRDAGSIGAFLAHIQDAKDYAFEIYDDETVSVLEKAPSSEIGRMLSVFGEEYGFDDETVAEIAAEPYHQAFETAYSYLEQAGLDADEVLSAFIESNEVSE